MSLTLVGLPDGGITFIFDDHPAHHRIPGRVEVSFSHMDLSRAVLLAAQAMDTQEDITLEVEPGPEDPEDESRYVHYHLDGFIAHPGLTCRACENPHMNGLCGIDTAHSESDHR